jgi:hypothetical protein
MGLKLDPSTHDLFVSNFQFAMNKTKTEDLAQRLKIKLLWFLNDWFLDESYGIPYFEKIFVKGTSKDTVDDTFKLAIASEDGVDVLMEYNSVADRSTRQFTVEAKVKTTEGEILNIPLSISV